MVSDEIMIKKNIKSRRSFFDYLFMVFVVIFPVSSVTVFLINSETCPVADADRFYTALYFFNKIGLSIFGFPNEEKLSLMQDKTMDKLLKSGYLRQDTYCINGLPAAEVSAWWQMINQLSAETSPWKLEIIGLPYESMQDEVQGYFSFKIIIVDSPDDLGNWSESITRLR